jgi:hypothetical protein
MSTLRIIAAAYKDGWAFVEDGDRIVLVRPPYHRSRLVEVSRAIVERGVQRYGFETQAQEVSDWRALIVLLQEKRASIADAEGAASLPDNERMTRLLRVAPRDLLERYLDRAEKELIPAGELDAALRVLAAMSRPDIKNIDAPLRERVSALIVTCSDALEQGDDRAGDLLDCEEELGKTFPSVKKAYGAAAVQYAKRIQMNGQILSLGGGRR